MPAPRPWRRPRVLGGLVFSLVAWTLIAGLSDVLNTAARIQGMCNELGSAILLSESLQDRLPDDERYRYEARGEISLRGREEQVALFSVEADL